jgi:chromosome partitioning protein
MGKRVLLVDLDPQAGLTGALGFRPEELSTTTYALLLDEVDPKTAVLPTKVAGLFLIPANLDLAGAEAELLGEIGWDRTLRTALSPLREEYDFIILDCPPSLGVLTVNALMAAVRAIVPVQTEYLALRSLKHLGEVITKVQRRGNSGLKVKILRTMHQGRSRHAQEASSELEKLFPGRLYHTVITRTVRFAEAARSWMMCGWSSAGRTGSSGNPTSWPGPSPRALKLYQEKGKESELYRALVPKGEAWPETL